MHRTLRIVTEGWLPGWLALAAFVLLVAVVLRNHRREFAASRSGALVRWVLPGIRTAIVGLLVWLLARPVIQLVSTWQEPPRLLVLVDSGRSMRVREDFGALHRKLDVLAQFTDSGLPARDATGSRLAQAAGRVALALDAMSLQVRERVELAGMGLPVGPDFLAAIRELGVTARAEQEALRDITPTPAARENATLGPRVEDLLARKQSLVTLLEALATAAEFTAKEGGSHLQVVEDFGTKSGQTAEAARSLQAEAERVQAAADESLIPGPVLAGLRERSSTRLELARRAIGPAAGAYRGEYRVETAEAAGLDALVAEAFRRHIENPVRSVLLLSDGSAELDAAGRYALEGLAAMRVPVSAVLVGADGREPADAGLVAVDVPGVASRGQSLTARVWVKQQVADESGRARVVVRDGDAVVAQQEIPRRLAGLGAVELSLSLPSEGRRQLVFEVATEGGDACPGNEDCARVVDVLPERARVLLVSDRLSDDFAALRGALDSLAFARTTSLLCVGDEEAGGRKAEQEGDALPATEEEWRALTLAVLVGGVPAAWTRSDAGSNTTTRLEALRGAIEGGLNVLIQVPPEGEPEGSAWSRAFGLRTARRPAPCVLSLRPGFWPDLYRLGKDEASSRAAWDRLAAIPSCAVLEGEPGIPLLMADGEATVALVPRGRGFVLFSGLPGLSLQRSPATSRDMNRLMAGLLTLGCRPLAEPGSDREGSDSIVLFPPQPVLGTEVCVSVAGGAPDRTEGLAQASAGAVPSLVWRTVASTNEVVIESGTTRLARRVEVLRGPGDFVLAARAEPLAAIAARTGGRFSPMDDLGRALPPPDSAGEERRRVAAWKLWPIARPEHPSPLAGEGRGEGFLASSWPLFLLLVLASAEYLLRRRTGRVM